MKKLFKLSLLPLLLLSITFQLSHTEPGKLGFGLTGGYLNASNNVNYVYNCEFCKTLTNFSKGGYFIGITHELPLTTFLETSLLTKLYYNSFSNLYHTVGDTYPFLLDDGKGGYFTSYSITNYNWDLTYGLISLDIMPKIKIPIINLGVFAGVSISYLLNSSYTEFIHFDSPDLTKMWTSDVYLKKGYRYADSNMTLYTKEGSLPYKNDFRYTIKAGLNYDFQFMEMTISPFISMDYPLSEVVNGSNSTCSLEAMVYRMNQYWKITYYQFGIDLKYLF